MDKSDVSIGGAAKTLSQFTGFEGRQQIYRGGGLTIIGDSYNASPVFMKATIDILVSMKSADSCTEGYRIVALAGMKELGECAPRLHYEIDEYLVELPVGMVVAYGELAQEVAKGIEAYTSDISIYRVSDEEELTAFLGRELKTGDSVLFRGPNSMKLGGVVKHARQYHY